MYLEELNNNKYIKETIERRKKIKEIGKLDFIDRNILNELVDVIYITEDEGVEVIFKYKNLYEDSLRYLKSYKLCYNWLAKILIKRSDFNEQFKWK